MLIQSLIQEFNVYFERDAQPCTILWFDPEREWEGLLSHLQLHLPLLIYHGSLLELRHQLVERSPNERAVVYLPFEKLQRGLQTAPVPQFRKRPMRPGRAMTAGGEAGDRFAGSLDRSLDFARDRLGMNSR
jgi:hypothetical protein